MNDATTNFESLQPHLLGVAYRMLGTWSDAEDAVQSAWLRAWSRAQADDIANPRAWWTRVVVRQCLDERAQAYRARETYVGPWLPEPLGEVAFAPLWGAARAPAEQQTLRLGMLRLMQTLTPLELAAFLLRDVFDDDYSAIAATLEREEPAVRQLVRRAREHLAAEPTRFSVDRHEHETLLYAFAQAAATGDIDGVRVLLQQHCVARTDGGGEVSAAIRPVSGAVSVARFYVGIARLRSASDDGAVPRVLDINGLPALGIFGADGTCDTVLQFVVVDGMVVEVMGVRNPGKLGFVG
jgi:RNA polymerase sigma-70 factor (ECF subfamily)